MLVRQVPDRCGDLISFFLIRFPSNSTDLKPGRGINLEAGVELHKVAGVRAGEGNVVQARGDEKEQHNDEEEAMSGVMVGGIC
jgi:hypothetical protein